MTEPIEAEPKQMKRANWLPAPAAFNLNMACVAVNNAFGNSYGCYLVGSSTWRRDYRDVDVRFIMADEAWDRMFGAERADRPDLHPLWALTCSGISCWLQQQTGLPVDFQIQKASVANTEFSRKDGHERQPLGFFCAPTPRDYAASKADGQ